MAKDKQVNMSVGFSAWLDNVTEQYMNLKDEEKNETLDQLISVSGSSQLCYLLKKMKMLVYRDFLKLLPLELTEYLLTYLDGDSLVMCCQVSHHWNRTINSLPRVWQQACIRAGFDIDRSLDNYDASYWKSFYLSMRNRRYEMKSYKSFYSRTYERDLRRVTAVFYYQGKVAAASESKLIRIWDCTTDKLLKVLRTDSGVSSIKFNNEYLIASSYLGHMVLWDIQTGERLYEFMRHTGAIFSFDFSMRLNLLVSGAADSRIKFWSISNGVLYKTIPDHSSWVIKIILTPYPADSGSDHKNQHLLLSMDKYFILLRLVSFRSVKDNPGGLYLRSLYSIPIDQSNPNAFIPGVYFDGKYIHYVKDTEDSTSSSVLCQWDVENRMIVSEINLQHKVKTLLAVGKKYIAFLKPYQCKTIPNFSVLDRNTLETVACWKLPVSRPHRPESANFSFGEKSWLDGLDGNNDRGVVLAAGTEENSIYVLKWMPREIEKS